jgi:hypothetical protein
MDSIIESLCESCDKLDRKVQKYEQLYHSAINELNDLQGQFNSVFVEKTALLEEKEKLLIELHNYKCELDYFRWSLIRKKPKRKV